MYLFFIKTIFYFKASVNDMWMKNNENSLCCFISVGIINEKPVKNEG